MVENVLLVFLLQILSVAFVVLNYPPMPVTDSGIEGIGGTS